MAETLEMPGVAEAERLYGRPEVRDYELAECGDLDRFWEMWRNRLGEVVLVIRRPDGRVILQSKDFYPPGTYRLPTGGTQAGEDLLAAVRRELVEETGLTDVRITHFLGVLRYHFRRCHQPMTRVSYVFVLEAGPGAMRPQDQTERISDFREVPVAELEAIAGHLEHMQGEWAVWGRFRAIVHRFVAEKLARKA